jgi:hypothetical protein
MLSKPAIIAILVALCVAVVYLCVRIGLWLGARSAKRLRATNPNSFYLSWVTGALYVQAMVIGVLLIVPLWLGSVAPAGSFLSTYFGKLGWPSLVLVFSGAAAAEVVSRVLKHASYARFRVSGE